MTDRQTSMSAATDQPKPHAAGIVVLRKLIASYAIIRQMADADAVLGAEMGQAEYAAFRLLTLDDRAFKDAVAEIRRQIQRDGMVYYQPDPPLPILVVRGYSGVRFAMKGGGYAGPDEPDHEPDIGRAESSRRYF